MKRLTWIVWPLSLALAVVVTWFASLYVFERPRLGPQVQQRSLASQVLAESREYLHKELAKWARVVKETGAQPN